ncbi:MAG: ribonuclease III [Acidimicrobiales bacterium]
MLDRLRYRFRDGALLELALTHRSWCAEHPGTESNERLEFLGDAVLGLAVTEHLYQRWPDRPEGELAPIRAAAVSAATLAEAGLDLGLGAAVRLGKGEEGAGGRSRPSILADALEAVFGAVYLDGGWAAAREVVIETIGPHIPVSHDLAGHGDFKTRLQELAATRFDNQAPVYDVVGRGPDHAKVFRAEVRIGGQVWGHGQGRSKKEAEQAAAGVAFAALAAGVAPDDTTERGERDTDA